MLVFRIASTRWAHSLDGEGARLHGGRWNHIGTPCIYTSETRALAILEYTVNTNVDDIPRRLSIITIEITDSVAKKFRRTSITELPGDWRDSPGPNSTKDFGAAFLQKKQAGLIIPSVIIPKEFNYLLNPSQNIDNLFSIIEVEDFVYDVRIKSV